MRKRTPQQKGRGKSYGVLNVTRGVIEVTRSGKGFLIMPEGENDIPIPRDSLGGALSGDLVEVSLRKGRTETIGQVVKVLERKRNYFVGEVTRTPQGLVLKPDDTRVYMEFLIVGGVGTPAGQKVIADVVSWDSTPPQVTVRRALGPVGHHDTEIRAILADREFDADFPQDVAREAEALYTEYQDQKAMEREAASRRDFRKVPTITIDPDTAKDFDDAISYQQNKDGTVEIGVHIADVSHFVRPNSALDREAKRRGTSVYMVDRTIPMLPHQLSDDLCSLVPHVPRLTFSAVFTVKGTTIVDRWFGKSVISSQQRLTYDEADAALKDTEHPLNQTLSSLWSFAKHLRTRRSELGSIMFDRDELRPILNEKKEVAGFTRTRHTESHQLIEELMLLANREVASLASKKLGKKNRVFIYRVHDAPNMDKLEDLSVFLRAIGYQLTLPSKRASQKDINTMLASIRGAPEERLISTATIRSMARAEYSTKNIGHFGLSFGDYATFTSPIRRYPDIAVHRVLSAILANTPIADEPQVIQELAVHASEREALAASAERESIKMKAVEYLAKKIGQLRSGTISGVTEWGLYIEDEESGGEGMVRVLDMADDTYEYEPRKFALTGRKHKESYRLGDHVTFTVTRANLKERTLDLAFAPEPAS